MNAKKKILKFLNVERIIYNVYLCKYAQCERNKNVLKIIIWYFTVVDNSSIYFFYVYHVTIHSFIYVFRDRKPMVKTHNYNVPMN